MPGRYYGGRRNFNRGRSGLGSVIDSNKNSVDLLIATAAGAQTNTDMAITVDAAANTSQKQVTRGCKIFRIWIEFTARLSATAVVGISTLFNAYIIKNPGDNLTPPGADTTGTSNEKKFIFREWKSFLGAQTEGANLYHFRGWIKIPKLYQRMGADDTFMFCYKAIGANSIYCMKAIYKWYK